MKNVQMWIIAGAAALVAGLALLVVVAIVVYFVVLVPFSQGFEEGQRREEWRQYQKDFNDQNGDR